MADIVVGPVAEEVVKCAAPPIKRGFNYLCCFTSNINNLKHEAEDLEAAEKGIEMKVETALDAGRVKDPTVDNWLAKAKEIKDEKTAILDQVPNVGNVCLNLRTRFSLSKTAKKTTDRMKELRDECSKFGDVSLPGPSASSKPILLGNAYEFESRKQMEEDIMAVLRGGDMRVIGISGMGGLGKTTMAMRIKNRVLEERVFEEAVFAVVSQPIDKPKIQLDIGGQLGLKLQDEPSETVRIQKLHERLGGTKRTLLVLDDVWEEIKLEEFGIPRNSKGCTILITSRNKDTLSKMDVHKEFRMKVLSEEEAWFLFREKVGTCIDDAELKSIAKGVVKKCEGLPIALATLGSALKHENNPSVWRDALRQLSQCVPEDADYIARVYTPLILSYDFLRSERAKFMFLLCSLYPEDVNIDVEELTYFGMGMGIFKGIKSLEEVRDNVSSLITMLRSRSLLLDSDKINHVRMHDVVRDVCIFIAKQEGHVGGNNCHWISSYEPLEERTKLPTGLGCQNLRLLFLSPQSYYESRKGEAFKFDGVFFEENSDLYVLCIQSQMSLTSLPHFLKNLKSLVLDSCDGLETLSVVGGFVNLEILICRYCDSIEELPSGIKGLNRLKLLDLTGCRYLQRIGQGIVSSLTGLEELKMLHSFNRWESEHKEERENAGLRELGWLTNLRCLEIEIEDPTLATEDMHLSPTIKKFCVMIGTNADALELGDHSYNKTMVLEMDREEPCFENGIWMQLLGDTEYLDLNGNCANSMDLSKCQNIRWLKLTSMDYSMLPTFLEHLCLCFIPNLQWICDGPISSNSFHNLKELKLYNLAGLKQLWKSSVPPLFTNLSSINIEGCHRLCNLGELSIAGNDCFQQLQELVIRRCEKMKQVFLWDKEDDIRNDTESQNDHGIIKVFPKLKKVELENLRNLATFYQGMDGIEFPLMTKLYILNCPKLKTMGSNHNFGGSSVDIDDDSSQHLFCQPKKVFFGNLKTLSLFDQRNPFCGHTISLSLLNGLEELIFSKLHGGRSLFSSSVAENLVNLRRLIIQECTEMLIVIEDNKEDDEKVVSDTAEMPLILFPKLEELSFYNVPKLESFCEWKCDIELPSLRRLFIWGPMKIFTKGSIAAAPNMKNVTINRQVIGGCAKDLNGVLKQYMARVEKRKEETKKREEEKKKKMEEEIKG